MNSEGAKRLKWKTMKLFEMEWRCARGPPAITHNKDNSKAANKSIAPQISFPPQLILFAFSFVFYCGREESKEYYNST